MRFPHKIDADLELRLVERAHALAIYALIDRNRAYLRRWQNWPDSLWTLADVRALIDRLVDKRVDDDGIDLVIYFKGQPVGKIGLVYVDWINRRSEIGYWISAAYEGRGLVTRSCHALLNHAFGEMSLETILIRCASENIRSRAIPERLGFTYTGALPHKTWLHGGQIEEVMFTLTAETWYAITQS